MCSGQYGAERGGAADAHGTVEIQVVLMQAISMHLPGPMPARNDPTCSCTDMEGSTWGGRWDAVYNGGTAAIHVVSTGIKMVGFPPETNHWPLLTVIYSFVSYPPSPTSLLTPHSNNAGPIQSHKAGQGSSDRFFKV
jgi:hypothetical protein